MKDYKIICTIHLLDGTQLQIPRSARYKVDDWFDTEEIRKAGYFGQAIINGELKIVNLSKHSVLYISI